MAPVQVRLLDAPTLAGASVTIDIEADTPKIEIKRQLALKTGVPIQHIKVVLAGIDELVMGDKRQLRFTHCGTASNAYFAVAAATSATAAGGSAPAPAPAP